MNDIDTPTQELPDEDQQPQRKVNTTVPVGEAQKDVAAPDNLGTKPGDKDVGPAQPGSGDGGTACTRDEALRER